MGSESLGDLFIAITANAMLAAGETHIDYEFWNKNSMDNRATFALPNLIFKHSFCARLFTIEAWTYVRHVIPFPLWVKLVKPTAGYYRAKRSYCK